MEGWIKLHRKFVEWEWFNVDEMVKLFIYLLLTANHEATKWRGIEIKRGQLLTGRKSLHDKTKISEQTLRTCLSRLEKTGEINLKSTNKYTIITICNYESYQSNQPTTNQLTNQQLTNDQPTTNQQLTTNKNDKKEKNDNNDKNIPPKIEDVKIYCQERNNKVDSEKWYNFYSAKGWMIGKNKMKDWKAAVRTWENKKEEKQRPKLAM